MSAPFVHLHCHSEYSILDGACRIGSLVERAVELEMPAVTITDHGTMAGSLELYRKATKAGIKPIIGCEIYVVEDRRARETGRSRSWSHLTVLAETTEGYANLVKLVTAGYLDGYHYAPRVDLELMQRHAGGLIVLTGCMSSRVNKAILAGDMRAARGHLDDLVQIYGRGQVYLEVQDAGLAEHQTINAGLLALAAETGLPLVGSGDVHYLRAEDASTHDILLCIQTGSRVADEKRFRFSNQDFYFKTPDEMQRVFAPYGHDLLRPTIEIAERCNVELELGKIRLPRFDVPGGEDSFVHLERLARAGLARRYDRITPELENRLAFELATVREMGFADYFLIVADFVGFAKRNGIAVGPGRGSAAGAIVAYCLEITDLDPIRYDLLFERFLNPARKSMPDVDIDFSVAGRERVMNYVVERYGRERVAQIITFGKLAAKAATRDTGRVLGLPYDAVDRLSKMIPEGPKIGFAEALAPGQDLRRAYDAEEAIGVGPDGRTVTVRGLVDIARELEGLVRQDSIHAAAVVIGDRPLDEYLPLQRKGAGSEVVTQYAMGDVEALGLLKMDFLGLRNLDVLTEALSLIRSSHGVDVDLSTLPLDDEATYAMLSRGDATGIFQFESTGMRDALRQVRPTEFEDLIALVALYRPGPMANIPTYAARKHGREPVTYTDPRLEPILGSTKGVYIYQEQAMLIAKELAGFSPAEADDLRKAIGKKIASLMASLKERFLSGCVANGVDPGVAARLWEENERSADYSFNKAHAACYALISYQTAYLKAHYPAEYMAALISSVMDTKDRVPFYVAECNEMGIEVLPPDVNESQQGFAVVDGRIRFGLSAVKNVGENAVRDIIRVRDDDGRFTSVFDFCERVDSGAVNTRVLESLIRAGALSSTGATRAGMLAVADAATTRGRKIQADRQAGQFNLFDGGADTPVVKSYPPIPTEELEQRDLMAAEREVLGLYLTCHPLTAIREQLERKVDCSLRDVGTLVDGSQVTIGGLISSVNARQTRAGGMMAFVTLEDLAGTAEVAVFSRAYERCRHLLEPDRIVIVKGTVKERGADRRLAVDEMLPFDAVAERRTVRLRIDARQVAATAISELSRVVRDHPGEHTLEVELETSLGRRLLRLGPEARVAVDSAFVAEVRARFGDVQVA